MPIGDVFSGFLLALCGALCLIFMLALLKWAMNKRLSRRKWSWGMNPYSEARVVEQTRIVGYDGGLEKVGTRWKKLRRLIGE